MKEGLGFMTYRQIFTQFLDQTKIDGSTILDFRMADQLYVPEIAPVNYIPNAIVVWLNNGSKLIYIAKEDET